jgi:hypothetical protein
LRQNRIMLKAIGTGFTFRFREWLRRSDQGLTKNPGRSVA